MSYIHQEGFTGQLGTFKNILANMARTRFKLARIVNESARKAALKSRRASLFKKIEELSILCDVEAGAIVYSSEETEAVIWPSYQEIKQMLERFLCTSIVERTQKMVTHEGYLAQMVAKQTEKNNREMEKNDKREAQEIMNRIFEGRHLSELNFMQLDNIYLLTSEKLSQLEGREIAPPPSEAMFEIGSENLTTLESLMNDKWFMETMAHKQDIPEPGVFTEMGLLPSEYASGSRFGTGGDHEEELPNDLNGLFPHIYSP